MQATLRLFLAVLLAHLLGDFPFQSTRLVAQKLRHWWAHGVHGIIHFILLVLALRIFIPSLVLSHGLVLAASIAYIAAHMVIDVARQQVVKRGLPIGSASVFLVDQGLHLATMIALTGVLAEADWRILRLQLIVPDSLGWGDLRDCRICGRLLHSFHDAGPVGRCFSTPGRIGRAVNKCRALHWLARASPHRHGGRAALPGSNRTDFDRQVHRSLSGDEGVKIRGIFFDRHAIERQHCAVWRLGASKAVARSHFPAMTVDYVCCGIRSRVSRDRPLRGILTSS